MSQRYFESVQIGDEIEPVEKTPTADMAIDFFGRDNPTNPAFADAEAGKRMGVGGALVPGALKMSWLMRYVSDWAGPAANIRTLRVALRRPDVAGRPLTLSGRIVDKREDADGKIIELEVVTLADGQPSIRAMVLVDLPAQG